MGLPLARARELAASAAWRRAAGEAIARRTPSVRLVRGVLEVELEDAAWSATLAELAPELAARLAGADPALKLKRLRLRARGEVVAEADVGQKP